MLKFVVDVEVGNKTLQALRNDGFDFISILEIERAMADYAILSIAESEGRIGRYYGQRFWRVSLPIWIKTQRCVVITPGGCHR